MWRPLVAKSRTRTLPRRTVVSVPAQVSFVSHLVPRVLADDDLPTVRKLPWESPHRWRDLRFFVAAADAPLAFVGHGPILPVRYVSVTGRALPRWRVLNLPP